ncbi:hypothetical protein QC762_105075 [Podospora pseudocomata]|uniref:Uncharacterized protein n=1 Tax=Podospora pseudocomata TaxID=2093779 RepID=A0ABR0GSY6_9PEZI|nr:hypothetical protein QC762_105075 [Podospora pseudocomata]
MTLLHTEKSKTVLDLYELLMKLINGAIEGFADAGNVKANLKSLYGAHNAFTLTFTIATGIQRVFGFFTTWFAIYNPPIHKNDSRNRHKIIISSHWIASIVSALLGLLSGISGSSMASIATNQIQVCKDRPPTDQYNHVVTVEDV